MAVMQKCCLRESNNIESQFNVLYWILHNICEMRGLIYADPVLCDWGLCYCVCVCMCVSAAP